MSKQSVMAYKLEGSSYTELFQPLQRPSQVNFYINNLLYEEYVEACRNHFHGSYLEFLQYRDYA